MDLRLIDLAKLKKSFEKKYIPEPNSGCYLWLGGVSNGYGQIFAGFQDGKMVLLRAHRAALLIEHGPQVFEGGKFACHRCDNKLCVNPGHLFPGTHLENMEDAVRKGRFVFGEDVPASTLTNDQAIEIASMSGPAWKIAEMFNASPTTVRAILNGSRYQRVTQVANRNRRTKLTDEEVAAIRNSNDSGVSLAARYGVSEAMISRIRRGSRRQAAA